MNRRMVLQCLRPIRLYVCRHPAQPADARYPSSLRTPWLARGSMGGRFRARISPCCRPNEDSAQARAARLPSVNAFQPIHLHRRQRHAFRRFRRQRRRARLQRTGRGASRKLLSFVRHGEVNRALAAEAVARAKVDVAARGLNADRDSGLLRDRSPRSVSSPTRRPASSEASDFSTSRRSRRRAGKRRMPTSSGRRSICSSASAICRRRSSPSTRPRSRWAC